MASTSKHVSVLLKRLDTLVRTGKFREAEDAAALAEGEERDVADALLESVHLSEQGEASRRFDDVVSRTIAAADEWWEEGKIGNAAYALSAGVRTLFHRELHADTLDSPLLTNTEHYLAPLYASRMFTDVTNPLRASTGAPTLQPQAEEVLLLPGSYPNFSTPLVAALEANPAVNVRTLNLAEHERRLRWLGINSHVLHHRVSLVHSGADTARLNASPELLDGANVIVADWGDRGAMWASCHAPNGARVVIRLHGMDVLSPWLHFVNWSRVSDLVAVSEPLLDLAVSILGDRLRGVRLHVVEHSVDASRFVAEPNSEKALTVGMIGWGKLVKDPAWALEVLSELLRDGQEWKLLLLGHPLKIEGSTRTREYAQRVWDLIEGPLAPHVELLPFTDDVPAVAAQMGYILSSSRRESFHLAVAEGALSGAVPVVRDWPVYPQGSVERIYPLSWVVSTPAEAAERIRTTLSDRGAIGREARKAAIHRFDPDTFMDRTWRAVLTAAENQPDAAAKARAAISDLNLTGETTLDLAQVATGVLREADVRLEHDDLDGAAHHASLALEVLFHRELHSDRLQSPLVNDPRVFLEPLRESRIGALLLAPVGTPAPRRVTKQVVVTPGPFNDFHLWVVDALRQQRGTEVRVADRDRLQGFNTMRMDERIVRDRLAHALSRPGATRQRFDEQIADADVLLLDWADKMAVLATISAPTSARIVVRLHSVDFLRPWFFLLDWGRVESIICLSEGMADLTRDLLRNGVGVEPPPIHVVRNEAPIQALERPKTPRAAYTLGMIGWAKPVKDPIWALDVLTKLREKDSRWRLVLIGSMFPVTASAAGARYEREFWRRVQDPGIREHVVFIGFTDDIGAYLQEVGYILSTSRRESFHRAVLEGVLSGAVPIVRDWPIFARHRAAATVYPQKWVVESSREAVGSIQRIANGRWEEERTAAREHMLSLTPLDALAELYGSIVIGWKGDQPLSSQTRPRNCIAR